jgi:hypothetical protein
MVEHHRLKTRPLTTPAAPVQKFSVFGPPQLLADEDPAAYDELLGRLHAAVKPDDIIDVMLIADVAALEWDVLRWRRLKISLLQSQGLNELEKLLAIILDYESYEQQFVHDLAEVIEDNWPDEEEGDFAQKLANKYIRDDPKAVEKIDTLFTTAELDWNEVHESARALKAHSLVRAYAQRRPEAIKHINCIS